MYNTNRDVLEWIQGYTGGSIHKAPRRRSIQHKPEYILETGKSKAVSFLTEILPYLRIKKPQAELAILFQQSFTGNTIADYDVHEMLYQEMHLLNKKGV